MRELLLILRDILALKRGPQDLPYAPNLTAVVVVAGIVFEFVASSFSDKSPSPLLLRIVVWHLVPIGLFYLLLHARGFNSRFVQTVLARAMVGLFFLVLATPLVVVLADFNPQTTQLVRPGQMLAGLLFAAMAIWMLCIQAHILRHSLEVPFFVGVLIALLVSVANVIMQMALFGASGGTAAGVGV